MFATGRKIGVRMTTAADAVTRVPAIRSRMFIAIRNRNGEDVTETTNAAT